MDLLRDLEQLKKDYEDESAELQRIGREITSLSNRYVTHYPLPVVFFLLSNGQVGE